MATTNPRITVTLKPHVYDVVKRLATLNGQSMSSIVSELLETVHPPLMRTIAILEAAAAAPKQVREGLKKTVEDMEREITKSAGSSISQLDWLLGEISASDGGASRSADTPPDAPNPHMVIRGSGSESASPSGAKNG